MPYVMLCNVICIKLYCLRCGVVMTFIMCRYHLPLYFKVDMTTSANFMLFYIEIKGSCLRDIS